MDVALRRHGVVVAMLLVQLLLISPVGEFALNDDWAAALAVRRTLETGQFTYPSFLAPYHLVPIIVGLGLSWAVGFSFTLLRLIGVAAAAASLLLLYRWLRRSDTPVLPAAVVTLLLWVNPLFLQLAYTFMSDVPALALMLGAVITYQRGFARHQAGWLLAGSLLTILGFFTRQVLLGLLFAAAVYSLARVRPVRWQTLAVAFGGPLLVTLALSWWLGSVGVAPGEVGARWLPLDWSLLRYAQGTAWAHLTLLSLFVAPVTVAVVAAHPAWLKRRGIWLATVVLAVVAWISLSNGYAFPALGNLINQTGLGPVASVLQGSAPTFGPPWAYAVAYLVSCGLLAWHAVVLYEFVRQRRASPTGPSHLGFLWLFSVGYAIVIVSVSSFDRYLLLLLPAVLWLVGQVLTTLAWSRRVALLLIALLASYSLVGTQHYLAWNQARWTLGQRLVASGTALRQIEGGYEWNGWYLYDQPAFFHQTPTWAPWYVQQLTPGHQMEVILSYSPLGGYRVVDLEWVRGARWGIRVIYASVVQPGTLP